MRELITSKDNPHIKKLTRLLSEKKERDDDGLFVCEGVRLCLDMHDAGAQITRLYLTNSATARYPEVSRLIENAGQVFFISDELAGRIGDTATPQGVFCICKKLDNSQSAVTIKRDGKYLLLSGLQDPGNLGTILRTANALGIDGAWLCSCTDLYSPKSLRAAMGATARLPVCIVQDMPPVIKNLRQAGVNVYAAALATDAVPVSPRLFNGGSAVLIGNEGNGLPEYLILECSGSVMIPMANGAQSLNAATAAGILLWEMSGHASR